MFFVFMGMLMMALSGSSLGTGTREHHNHNGEKHDALCSVLGAVVTLYRSRRGGQELRKALRRALFGNENEKGDLNTLLAGLPDSHNNPETRSSWCGSCRYGGGEAYPGISIPHDLLCLCTVGEGGHPFKSTETVTHLCGQGAADLGCNGGDGHRCSNVHGWSEHSNGEQAKEHINATWHNIVKTCLKKKDTVTLEQARNNLMKELKPADGTSPIWARGHSYGCGGHWSSGICVDYTLCDKASGKNTPQWWEALQDALPTANFDLISTHQMASTTPLLNSTYDDEDEDGDELGPNGDSHNGTHHGSSSTRRRRKRSSHAVSHLFKEDGTLLTPPFLWSLGALVSWL